MLSQTTEYAIRAIICIAREEPRSLRLMEIVRAIDAPPRYLAKILSQLAHAGYLRSTRGPAGGYSLPAGGAGVNLADIAGVFERRHPQNCLLGTGPCGQVPDCPVHQRWAPIAGSVSSFLAHTTVAELVSSRPPL